MSVDFVMAPETDTPNGGSVSPVSPVDVESKDSVLSFEELPPLPLPTYRDADEKEKVQKLLVGASDARADRGHDERDLIRFLRARKGDVSKALDMYLKCLDWRKKSGAESILETEDPLEPVYQTLCPHAKHAFDKEGHPIYMERTGVIRVPDMVLCLAENDIVERHIRAAEEACRRAELISKATGVLVQKQTIVMDLKGLSMAPDRQATRLFKATLDIDQNFYPERLHHVFIINANWVFRSLWKMIKGWLDPVTAAKFFILGSDYQSTLLEHIDAELLPKEFGGLCSCCDREPAAGLGHCLFVKEKAPESMLLKNRPKLSQADATAAADKAAALAASELSDADGASYEEAAAAKAESEQESDGETKTPTETKGESATAEAGATADGKVKNLDKRAEPAEGVGSYKTSNRMFEDELRRDLTTIQRWKQLRALDKAKEKDKKATPAEPAKRSWFSFW